jgi:hypothetical protein
MSWKISLGVTGIMALLIGGVFYAGQMVFQDKLTQAPQQDEPPPPFAAEQQEPPASSNQPVPPADTGVKEVQTKGVALKPEGADSLEEKGSNRKTLDLLSPMGTAPPVAQSIEPPMEKPELVAPPPKPETPPAPPLPTLTPPLPPNPGPPLNISVPPPVTAPKVAREVVKSPWTITFEVINGRTVLKAKAGKEAFFFVHCDQVDLQGPKGCLRASGKVEILDPLHAHCNVMILNLQEDRVTLEGDVTLMSCAKDKCLAFTGERLTLQVLPGLKTRIGDGNDAPRSSAPEVKKPSSRISTVGPEPIQLDFGFPVVPYDGDQLFGFWEGLFR